MCSNMRCMKCKHLDASIQCMWAFQTQATTEPFHCVFAPIFWDTFFFVCMCIYIHNIQTVLVQVPARLAEGPLPALQALSQWLADESASLPAGTLRALARPHLAPWWVDGWLLVPTCSNMWGFSSKTMEIMGISQDFQMALVGNSK